MGSVAIDDEGMVILLDTNVLIYASDPESPFYAWACDTISAAVADDGAGINTVALAELCVGDADPESVADRVRSWGIDILDVPAAVAPPCAKAYAKYRKRRAAQSGTNVPATPLPDFLIGAHALIMGWAIATADDGRFKSWFPTVPLLKP